MRLSPAREHAAHVILRSSNTGNFCGKRLQTITDRCMNRVCSGALISVTQRPVRAGQRPEKRRAVATYS